MKQQYNERIIKNNVHLRRSRSKNYILESLVNNPNVIVITTDELAKEYNEWWRSFKQTADFQFPKFIGINSDLTNLNQYGKPIIFDTYLILKK